MAKILTIDLKPGMRIKSKHTNIITEIVDFVYLGDYCHVEAKIYYPSRYPEILNHVKDSFNSKVVFTDGEIITLGFNKKIKFSDLV